MSGEPITVTQCALCLRATYTTTEASHDWFHVGEPLPYAAPTVCADCAIERTLAAEKRRREEMERERARGALFGGTGTERR